MHDATNFVVAANDRIDFSRARQGREVSAIFLERLEFVFRILVRNTLIAAKLGQRFENGVILQAICLENLLERGSTVREQSEQQMFCTGVIVLEFAGFGLGGVERSFECVAEESVGGALDLGAPGQFAFNVGSDGTDRDTKLL